LNPVALHKPVFSHHSRYRQKKDQTLYPSATNRIGKPTWRRIQKALPICYHQVVATLGISAQISMFFRHMLPALLRPIRSLWHEVIGFFFLVFAVWALTRSISLIREFDGDAESFFKLILIVSFVGLMGYYGITSFLRARKISRS
jgi:hypothetical protein